MLFKKLQQNEIIHQIYGQFAMQDDGKRRIKLILYAELSLAEISYRLHYSSPAHLSNQFKKITGLTPSFYKKMKQKRDKNLENM